MRHERWVGASVNEQKGREERESDSCLYYVAVTKAKKEYGNRPPYLQYKHRQRETFLCVALRSRVANSDRFLTTCATIRVNHLVKIHLLIITRANVKFDVPISLPLSFSSSRSRARTSDATVMIRR